MKKYYIVLITLTALLAFASCKKEDKITEATAKSAAINPLEALYSELPTPNFGNIKLVNGDILKFESADHYEQVYEALEAQCEAWVALFLQRYDTGNEDKLDSIIEQLKFDENLPLKKFEQKYKRTIITLSEAVAHRETMWLNQGADGAPPSDEITDCPIELTLLSNYHEYCIGENICQLRPNSCEIHIPSSKLSMLQQIRNTSTEDLMYYSKRPVEPGSNDPVYIPEPFNITIYPPKLSNSGSSGDCGCDFCYCTDYKKTFTKLNGTNHKFTLSYHFRHDFNKGKAKTIVTSKNYKFKKGSWQKDYSSYCRLGFSTKLYQNPSISKCIDKGRDGKTSDLTQAFSKSKSKVFDFDKKIVTDQIYNSYVTYRHKGTEFKFNPRGEVVP